MALNPYALCPCGSGKKIKFCCGDLAGEMEKVLRKVEGDQPAAAVRLLEQLLKRHHGRASLLDLKSNIEMQLGWLDQAQATIDEFLVVDSQNANAWARRATLLCLSGNPHEAVEALQRSISLLDDPPYVSVVLMAIRLVGRAFAMQDEVIPAMAHFFLYSDVSLADDMDGEREVVHWTREMLIPELVKGPFRLWRGSVDPSLAEDVNRAFDMAARGKWRKAVDELESLEGKSPGEAALVYNTALLKGFLGDREGLVEGLRKFAACDVAEDEAIEALALAQHLSLKDEGDSVEGWELVFDVEDTTSLVERLAGNKRTPQVDAEQSLWPTEFVGPPPQAAFFILDRESPDDWEGLSFDDTPRLLASLHLFGRETDRAPRVVVHLLRDAEYDSKLAAVRDLLDLGDAEPTSQEDAIGLSPVGNATIYYSYVPREASIDTRLRLYDASRLKGLLEFWPAAPQSQLGGKSPAELAGDSERARDVKAAVVRMLETQVPRRSRQAAEGIWQQLGLEPLPSSIDLDEVPPERLWFTRLRRADVTKLSDERLAKVTLDAALVNATRAMAHLAPELLRRPQLHQTVNMYAIGRAAASEAPDFEAAEAFLSEARTHVSVDVVPGGLWHVIEFEAALDNLQESRLADLFMKAAGSARRNEVVGRILFKTLADRGLISEDGRLHIPVPREAAAPAAPVADQQGDEAAGPSAIWTPESEAAQQGQGKLWLPS